MPGGPSQGTGPAAFSGGGLSHHRWETEAQTESSGRSAPDQVCLPCKVALSSLLCSAGGPGGCPAGPTGRGRNTTLHTHTSGTNQGPPLHLLLQNKGKLVFLAEQWDQNVLF